MTADSAEREAFEAWRRRTAKTKTADDAIARDGFGDDADYAHRATQMMWLGWLAGCQQASTEVAEQIEALDVENHALRQQVKALTKEAWTWNQALTEHLKASTEAAQGWSDRQIASLYWATAQRYSRMANHEAVIVAFARSLLAAAPTAESRKGEA
jgi:hypothetical protein